MDQDVAHPKEINTDLKNTLQIENTESTANKIHKSVLENSAAGRLVLLGKIEKSDNKPLPLGHISDIENPRYAGEYVTVEAIVSSTSRSYTVPSKVRAIWYNRDDEKREECRKIEQYDPINMALTSSGSPKKRKALQNLFPEANDHVQFTDEEYRTVYQLNVRPPIFTLQMKDGIPVDERGFEYKQYTIYVVTEHRITFQASSLLSLQGFVLPDPKTQRTTLLVTSVDFPEEVRGFDVEKLRELEETCSGLSHSERVKWVLDNFEKYAKIVSRRNVASAILLGCFTPTWIELDGERQRGWCNILIIGDTTTGKTETVRKALRLLGCGVLITAETASTVGLVGAATQSEQGSWSVDWGALVLNDGKLLAIDGAHKLTKAQHAALAEAERSGIVNIMKAAKETAYARTRQIKIANPLDLESRRGESKNLGDFMYRAQSVPTIFDLMSVARLDVAVFVDVEDVKVEEINRPLTEPYDVHLHLLADVIRWVYSGQVRIKFTEEALGKLLSEATRLNRLFFTKSIPLASPDLKWKLARLAAAVAAICLSTTDYETLTVEAEDVYIVSKFIEEEYRSAGLDSLAKFEQDSSEVSESDVKEVIAELERIMELPNPKKCYDVLNWIVLSSKFTKDQLGEKFELPEKSIVRPLLAYLKNVNLIRQGYGGNYPTGKLIRLCRFTTLAVVATPEEVSPDFRVMKLDGEVCVDCGKPIVEGSARSFKDGRVCLACAESRVKRFSKSS